MTAGRAGTVRRALAAAVLAILLAPGPSASAQPYDPRLRWRTVETPHFRVHHHDGLAALARRVAGAAERAHERLSPAFAHSPERRTEIVLSDDADDLNGSATPLPYDTIRLLAVPPGSLSELNDERDWVQGIVDHEYVHILHLGTIEGPPALVNDVLGRVLAPSGFSPSLVAEGLAVLHEGDEAEGGDGGRNASALFDMYARALALDGPFPRLDEVLALPLTWPRGNLPYLLGGRFFAFVEARSGAGALTAFSKDQGRQLWPYRLDTLARRNLGGSFGELWAAFAEDTRARARQELAKVQRRPVTQATPLTRRGSVVLHPRWLKDGSGLVYYDAGPDERSSVRRVGRAGEDLGRVALVEGNGTLAVRGERELVVAASDVYGEFRVWDDLRLVELDTGRWRQLTEGARATEPDVSPDGTFAVYVAHLGGGELALLRQAFAGGPPEVLLRLPGVQLANPRIAPDGRRIALELQEAGRRDVVIWEAGALTWITDDDALDLSPSWSPDGGTLYFSSERSGVYDVYAFELGAGTRAVAGAGPGTRPRAPGRLRQVTNVELGAFEPQVSPDGRTLAFVSYSRRGYDLASIPLDRAKWLEPEPARPRALRGPGAPPLPPDPTFPDHPYRPLDTLRPTFWLPWLGTDGGGLTAGAVTGGADVLLQHAYALQAWYGVASREPGYDAQYVGTWLFPRLTLGSSRSIGTTPGYPSRLEEDWTLGQVSLRATDTHLDRSSAVAVGWRALRLRSIGGPPGQPTDRRVAAFRDGTASELSFSASTRDAFRFVSSISAEEGRSFVVSARLARPELGGSFAYASARAAAAQYLRLPFTAHAVLALRGSVGVAGGSLGGREPFSLGGAPPTDVVELALAPLLGASFPVDVLRGYASGALAGSSLLSTTAELRFPIARVERGFRAWPVQLRRVHGALFVDAGGAFPALNGAPLHDFAARDRVRFGAGGELRLEIVLGYAFRTDLRLGAARGLGPLLAPGHFGGPFSDPLAETQLYLTLGPSF